MKCFVFGIERNNECRVNGCSGALVRTSTPDGKKHKIYSCSICGVYYMKATLFKLYSSDFECINKDEIEQCLDLIRKDKQRAKSLKEKGKIKEITKVMTVKPKKKNREYERNKWLINHPYGGGFSNSR